MKMRRAVNYNILYFRVMIHRIRFELPITVGAYLHNNIVLLIITNYCYFPKKNQLIQYGF